MNEEYAKWIPRNDGWFDFFQCLHCNKTEKHKTSYCPNCGKKMDLQIKE